MLPLWKLGGGAWPERAALKLHALRGAISAVMAVTFFWALIRLPLAEAIALSFIAPLIALYLAAVLLGERIERRAIVGSLLGFGGVIVIGAGRLGAGGFSHDAVWGIGAVLVSAVLYAFNLIFQRKQAQLAGPQEVALFQMGFSGLFLTLAAPFLLILPGIQSTYAIAGSAALAAVSLMLLSWGYGRAEAQVLLPIEYTAFIWAALIGWLMFGEAVTLATLGGVALIVLGCWIAARTERTAHTEQTAL
ncbi:DMT family transporter, partial [Novosphingobium sp.]|uniref:DMT family transporter n=1 Tax=Novosphingobium sp. TaxID=1874826 RepID=UPI00286E4564